MQRQTWLLPILALSACAPSVGTPAPGMSLPPASEADYAPYLAQGTGRLVGQAFLTTRGGDVKVAAGRTVTLDPATPYARAWFEGYGSDLARADELPPSSAFQKARRSSIADAEGRFHFESLPPGWYIVRTTVTWETGAQYSGIQGGVVAAAVDIANSSPTEVVLNTLVVPTGSVASKAPLLSPEQLGSRSYKRLKSISGISCNKHGNEAISEDAAKDDLAKNAADAKADAVINVVCKGGGFSLRHDCIQYFQCTGDGIAWT